MTRAFVAFVPVKVGAASKEAVAPSKTVFSSNVGKVTDVGVFATKVSTPWLAGVKLSLP